MATGTIFDSLWFRPEKPAFDKIANWSDPALSWALIFVAILLVYLAIRAPTLTKAVVLAWMILP